MKSQNKAYLLQRSHSLGVRVGVLLLLLLGLAQFYTYASSRADVQGDKWSLSSGSLGPLSTLPGRAMPRDIDTGAPSLASDRLVMDFSNVTPFSNSSFYAYLLAGASATGTSCGPLALNGAALQATCDFPGQNLIGRYDTFHLMQETAIFNATLPLQSLAHIRKVLVAAGDTPAQVGYAVGLVKQAQFLYDHATFARDAATAPDGLVNVRVHVEHTLNTLYGTSDDRYGDIDQDGFASDPSDTHGLLRYAQQVSQTLQLAASSADASDNIKQRAAQVQTGLGNLGNSTDGRWLALFIASATQALNAPTAADALPFTNQMVGLANRILNGEDLNDNGQIEPTTGEGGARTAHLYAQYTADYLSPTVTGSVRYGSSTGDLKLDQIVINLSGVTPVAAGEAVWIYLGLDNGERNPLGSVAATGSTIQATLTVAGRDLLAQSNTIFLTKGVKYAEAGLPTGPLPPIRKVLVAAGDTPAQVGYAVGLVKQAQFLYDHATFARDAATAPDGLVNVRVHVEHTLNTLYGTSDDRYGDIDQDGFASDPSDTHGLLRYAQQVSQTLQLAASSADASDNIKQRAAQVQTGLGNLGNSTDGRWLALFIASATQALNAPTAADALPFTNQMVGLANRILNGEDLNDNGQIEPTTGEGGALTAYRYSQSAADYYPELLVTLLTPTPTATLAGNVPTPTPTATSGTPDPSSDAYETDGQCLAAKSINSDGLFQSRTFHQQADNDWVRFDAVAGVTYIVEARVPPNSPADIIVELHPSCDAAATTTQDHSFSPDIRLRFEAPSTGVYYLRLQNNKPTTFGSHVAYQLSVSTLQSTGTQTGALIVVAGRIAEGDVLQGRIQNVTNRVYRLWRNNGYAADHIRYLAPDLGLDADLDGKADVTALPSNANLQEAITNWARDKVSAERALTIYLIDHGAYDKLYLDEPRGERLSPQNLNTWLTQLESAVPGVKINIIVEACNSGSFIDHHATISKQGRVVITSAGAFSLAWASAEGAAFSDAFLDALSMGQSLYLAFDEARSNAQRKHNDQAAWLDDDGDGVPNDGQDGVAAASRSFSNPGSFDPSQDGQWRPYVVSAEVIVATRQLRLGPNVIESTSGRGEIWAEVRDNSSVTTVLATIYPPSYQAPTAGEELLLGPPPITLQGRGNNMYAGLYGDFSEVGTYRIVVSAVDEDNLESRVLELEFEAGGRLFLPLVTR